MNKNRTCVEYTKYIAALVTAYTLGRPADLLKQDSQNITEDLKIFKNGISNVADHLIKYTVKDYHPNLEIKSNNLDLLEKYYIYKYKE